VNKEIRAMRRGKRIRDGRRYAFTLLEVLLVVAIIGLLAAAAVTSLWGTKKKTDIKLAKKDVAPNGAIATAIRLFYNDMGRYPETLEELYKRPEDVEEESDQWVGYLEDLSTLKDPWGREYEYAAGDDAEHNEGKYDLWSKGPKEDDDGDDIGNWRVEEE